MSTNLAHESHLSEETNEPNSNRESISQYSPEPSSKIREIFESEAEEYQNLSNITVISTPFKASILRSNTQIRDKRRKDSYGITITQGKQHKIKFKETVKEVKVVENWKKFNSIEEKPCCLCNIM